MGRTCPRAQQVATHALWTARAARESAASCHRAVHFLPPAAYPPRLGETPRTTSTNHMTLMITPRRRNGRPRSRNRRTRSRPSNNRARKWQTLARKRGIQRWSSLLTAQSSRLAKANGMRQFLGERCWDDFVQYANTHYREAFLQAFTPQDGVLSCKGPLSPISGSTTCPQCFRVDVRQLGSSSQLQSKIASERLALMHVDLIISLRPFKKKSNWQSFVAPKFISVLLTPNLDFSIVSATAKACECCRVCSKIPRRRIAKPADVCTPAYTFPSCRLQSYLLLPDTLLPSQSFLCLDLCTVMARTSWSNHCLFRPCVRTVFG